MDEQEEKIKKLEEEINQKQEELRALTKSESDKAYESHMAAHENCQELWSKYIDVLYKDKKAEFRPSLRMSFHTRPLTLNW